MTGRWRVEMGQICCESSEVPTLNFDGAVVGRSKAAVRFKLPIEFVLDSGTHHAENHPLCWEHSIRTRSLLLDFSSQDNAKQPDLTADDELDEAASYVEINGRRVQVCEDICENYPEASWANLMSLRLRFGT
jgi:hypothetical protein